MTGLIRLICELPIDPPQGQEGEPVVNDIEAEDVAIEMARLHANGWQLISQWLL